MKTKIGRRVLLARILISIVIALVGVYGYAMGGLSAFLSYLFAAIGVYSVFGLLAFSYEEEATDDPQYLFFICGPLVWLLLLYRNFRARF